MVSTVVWLHMHSVVGKIFTVALYLKFQVVLRDCIQSEYCCASICGDQCSWYHQVVVDHRHM
eukprot:3145604-Amphidinium_carterae.1